MKKYFISFIIFSLLFVIGASTVLAEPPFTDVSGDGGDSGGSGVSVELTNPLGQGVGFETAVKNTISAVVGLTGVLALIAFIWGGIIWMTSGGDTSKIGKGKTMMVWAITGMLVIFSSYAILTFVFTAFGFGSSE